MKLTRLAALSVALVASLPLAGCSSLDVVGNTAVTTFTALLDRIQPAVALDADAQRWVLTSPGAEQFEWSIDFAAPGPDFRVAIDAVHFLSAGLDPTKLPTERYAYDPDTRTLSLSFEVGSDAFGDTGEATPVGTFEQIVDAHRPIIGYHAQLDHYGIALGDGNMVEWAKDMTTNDMDLVFVLNPAPLVAAGVDPQRIQGWVFGTVEVKDDAGKTIEVEKFLKAYDLP